MTGGPGDPEPTAFGGRPRWAHTLAVLLSAVAFGTMRMHGISIIPIGGWIFGWVNAALVFVLCYVLVWAVVRPVRRPEDREESRE